MATIAPEKSASTRVSRVNWVPLMITTPTRPNDPTANATSLTTSFQNSRRAISSRRIVSSITQATEASPNKIAVVWSMPPNGSASPVVTTKTRPTAANCEWIRARRNPGSKRSSTVSESPIQPLCIELTVIRMPKSRLNEPSPEAPSCLKAMNWRTRLEPATTPCEMSAASGREAAEPDLTAMLQRPMVEHDTEHRRAQDVETQAHGFEVVRLGAPVDHEQHAICFAGES
jgi:hypothetical protein